MDPLGAFPAAFAEMDDRRRLALSVEANARLDSIESRRRTGEVTEAELVERFALVWPIYFVDPTRMLPPPAHVGADASIEVNRSLAEHFERRTLVDRLPAARSPALFVHGEQSVIPTWSTADTAALIPGAEVVILPGCGHFPWVECPGSVRRAVERFLGE